MEMTDDKMKAEFGNYVSALISRIMTDTDSCEEEKSYEELAMSNYELTVKNVELTQKVEEQVKEIAQLHDERFDNLAHISKLNDELLKLNTQLDYMREHIDMMTADTTRSKQMLKHSKEHHTKKKSHSWVCDHCKGKGHIRPYCFKLHDELKQSQQKPFKKRWTLRSINTGVIAHKSLRASSKEDWYFDSGCSRHMTGVDKYLEDVRPYANNYTTFGDGAEGKIVGIGNLTKQVMPRLDDVLLGKGVTANLISISQPCDLGLQVNFTKPKCQISDEKGEVLMRGTRSKENRFLWVSQEEAFISTFLLRKEEEIKLWHQRLGHLHLKGINKVLSSEAIIGLPDLKIVEGSICGECQIGKQTRMSYPMLEHQETAKVLELLHMDLMGPMQVESTKGMFLLLLMISQDSHG